MSEKILVNVTAMETRVALLEDSVVQDVHIERSVNCGIVGNIYAGKVVRVLPGLQAAFVDIGVERSGLLHVGDINTRESRRKKPGRSPGDDIRDHLHEGQKIIVQVTRDPLGDKGARLTTALSVSSRYLVLMPEADHIGVSALIEDASERERLQQVLARGLATENLTDVGGFILRTAAQGVDFEEIASDLRYLQSLWAAVSLRAKASQKAALLYADLPLTLRTVRDLARPAVTRISVDSEQSYNVLLEYCQHYMPEVVDLLEYYSGQQPLFDLYGVEEELQGALGRKVELASGGYLVIDQTEAMSTIDVNTGAFVGKRDQAETILKTNIEAANASARQLRLRNLGGIIIVDFIDMKAPEHRRQVHKALATALQRDPAGHTISGVSELGLVEMTRRRARPSLEHTLCEECHVCQGRGVLKTPETVCYDIFRRIMRDASSYESASLIILAAQIVVDRMIDQESAYLADLELFFGKAISIRADPTYSQEHFDIILH